MTQDTLDRVSIVETDRFDLRPIRGSDEGLLTHYAGDERVARMTTSIPHPLPPGSIAAMVARAAKADRSEDIWIIDGTKSGGGEVMGLFSLQKMDRNQSEISYWVAPPFWNTGLASDAVSALVAANPLHSDTMFGCVFQDNPASARVLVNCGFEYVGDAEAYCVARGTKVATWTYINRLG